MAVILAVNLQPSLDHSWSKGSSCHSIPRSAMNWSGCSGPARLESRPRRFLGKAQEGLKALDEGNSRDAPAGMADPPHENWSRP